MNVHLNSMKVDKHTRNISGEVHGSLTHWFPTPAALSSPGRPPGGRKHPLPPAGGKSTGGLAPLWELRCRGQALTMSPAAPRLTGSPEEVPAPSRRTTLITKPRLTCLHRLVSTWPLHRPRPLKPEPGRATLHHREGLCAWSGLPRGPALHGHPLMEPGNTPAWSGPLCPPAVARDEGRQCWGDGTQTSLF